MNLIQKHRQASRNTDRHDNGRRGKSFRRLSYRCGVSVRILFKSNDTKVRPRRKRGYPVYI